MLSRARPANKCLKLYGNVVSKEIAPACFLLGRVQCFGLSSGKQPLSTYTEKRRFYEHADVMKETDGYQITLDNKKVKTPAGRPLIVPNMELAVAVAVEWNSQKETVKPNNMHLTGLCNTVIDNPKSVMKEDTVNHILEFLHTDTVCFLGDHPDELVELQTKEWGPLLKWFDERFGVPLQFSQGLFTESISDDNENKIKSHLLGFNHWSLAGMEYAVETTKSLVISLALMERHLTVERAGYLSRLELEFQIGRWGSVEWAHDLDLLELKSRLAAATLFVHLNMDHS